MQSRSWDTFFDNPYMSRTKWRRERERFALNVTMTASADFLPFLACANRASRGPYRVESRYASLIMSVPGTRGKNQMASETGSPRRAAWKKKRASRGQSGKLACSKMIKCSPPVWNRILRRVPTVPFSLGIHSPAIANLQLFSETNASRDRRKAPVNARIGVNGRYFQSR